MVADPVGDGSNQDEPVTIPFQQTPVVQAPQEPIREEVIKVFKRECRRVRDGCNFDISKCFKDGKPLIIDGSHVDPECYLELIPGSFPAEYRIKTTLTEFPAGQGNAALISMQRKMQEID